MALSRMPERQSAQVSTVDGIYSAHHLQRSLGFARDFGCGRLQSVRSLSVQQEYGRVPLLPARTAAVRNIYGWLATAGTSHPV
jgi:hypothetical protein